MLVLKNNVDLVLPFAIAENQTNIALYVNAGKDLPALFTGDHARGAIRDNAGNVEYVKIVAVEGDNIILQRGQEGSVARAFSAGARLQLRMTARAWQDMALEFFTRVYNDDYTLIRPVATEVNSLVFQDDWLDVFQTGRVQHSCTQIYDLF